MEFVYAQGNRPDVDPALAEQGRKLYEAEGCLACHTLDGTASDQAPTLKGYASEAWLAEFIRTPDAPHLYGGLNQMDAFPHEKLSANELKAVIAFLRAQTDRQARFP